MSGSGNIGLFVDELFSAGKTMAGRNGGASASCNGLKTGVVDAAGSVGHPIVKQALNLFHDDHILDPATKLPTLVESGGHHVSNVSSTTRNLDNEGAHAVQAVISSDHGVASRMNPTPV